jgi:ATP-dependent Clp protease ATP-binding subunit ClpX
MYGVPRSGTCYIAERFVQHETFGDALTPTPTAHEIKSRLDPMVVGQETAKIYLSVLMSMHLAWFNGPQNRMHRTPNAILIGPTGSGKTHTLRVASEHLGIPFITVDATSIVPSGIVGVQIEDILADLVLTAGNILEAQGWARGDDKDIDLARQGIIFLDEFDKIATPPDAVGEAATQYRLVQRRLLKLIEGSVLGIGARYHTDPNAVHRSIDTSGILMLAGGAFAGPPHSIDSVSIRSRRPESLKRELAYNPNRIVSADLVSYGFIPELVARLPVLINYLTLTDSDLREILGNESISPLQVWRAHFDGLLHKALEISDDAKDWFVKQASALNMGARGLQQVVFPALAQIAYEIEDSEETSYSVTAQTLQALADRSEGS